MSAATTTTILETPATGSFENVPGLGEAHDTVPIAGKPTEALQIADGIDPPVELHEAEDESHYPTGAKLYFILLSMAVVLIFGALDSSIVAVAVPTMTDEFHTVADLAWYATAYRLAMCSTQFIFGKLYKIFSVKRIFLTGVFVFVVSAVLCATAPTSGAFVFGRAVNGLACGAVIAGCFTLLVQCMPLRKRPLYTAIFGAIEGISFMASPTLGGLVIDKLGWRWCFWISVPSGTFTLVVLWFILTDVKPAQQLTWRERISELDLVGTVVFVPSLTCLFIALGWAGSRYAWNSPTIIGLFCTFAVLLIAFALEQYRKGDRATLPPRILRNRSVLAGFLFSMCCNSGLSVVEFYLPTYFQAVRQYSAAQSGYLMFPIVGGFIVAMLGSGWGVSKIGYYVPFMILSSILMPVFSGLICTVGVDTELARIVSYCAFFGFAAGIGFQCPQSAVQTALPEADASIGISIILFAQQFGPAVSLTAAQSIFTNKLSQNLQEVAPGLDATAIESMGLTDIKNVVGAEYLNQVLLGLDRSLIQTWYLVVGLTCATMIGSLAMEWRSVKQKKH